MKYINAYLVDSQYGGPEEGGWWYDSGEPVASIPIPNQMSDHDLGERADVVRRGLLHLAGDDDRHKVNGGPDLVVRLEDEFAKEYPEERPHYE
jgi:hypothetical protein